MSGPSKSSFSPASPLLQLISAKVIHAVWLFFNLKPELKNSGHRLPHFLSWKDACDESFRKHLIGWWLPLLHHQAKGSLGLGQLAQEPACLVRTRTGSRFRVWDVMPKQGQFSQAKRSQLSEEDLKVQCGIFPALSKAQKTDRALCLYSCGRLATLYYLWYPDWCNYRGPVLNPLSDEATSQCINRKISLMFFVGRSANMGTVSKWQTVPYFVLDKPKCCCVFIVSSVD